MKYNILLLAILMLLPDQISAQVVQQRMLEDPQAGAGIFRPYFYDGTMSASKPKNGFEPFYISHFGRHGARYFSHPTTWQHTVDCFEAAQERGILSADGEALFAAIREVYAAHEEMYGELAPLGAVEHRQIAARMFERSGKVFSNKGRNQVRCASSIFSRCLMSMANFTEELSSLAPKLDISYTAGKKYNTEYLNSPILHDFNKEANVVLDSLKRANLHPESLLQLYFTDVEMAGSLISDPYAFEMGIYYFWAISYDLDFLGVDMTQFVPFEELARCSAIDNATKYAKVAISNEFGKHTRVKGVNMLKDFVAKADDALQQDSKVAADLRFAHDSAFLPMCSLLGVPGYPTCSIAEAHENWNAGDFVPMCSNLQMEFYRNKQGDVWVKVLVNEKEVALDGLTPVYGIFYSWNDLRNLIESLDSGQQQYLVNKSQINQLYE